MECAIYEKHHNIIDGIYLERKPSMWSDIPKLEYYDCLDEDGELLSLIKDINIYDIEIINNFNEPYDLHNITETIFIIRRNGKYYLCETQGENYIKFSIDISSFGYIKDLDRLHKISKISNKL